MTILTQVEKAFSNYFKSQPTHYFRAPGRVNLIGEHTDYNDGFVLPCAINFDTIVVAKKREDNLVKVFASDYQEYDTFNLNEPIVHHPSYQWANYVRGVAKSLQERGVTLVGCEIAVGGNIPQGTGLSSSASLEVVLGLAYSSLSEQALSSQENALNGQHAENNFVGCNCGIMDQLISAQGVVDKALLIDCRSLTNELVDIPENLSVMIINSMVKRGLVDSEYNTRRQQCEQAAEYFNVSALRDVDIERFNSCSSALEPIVAKRARHVITENSRTQLAAKALSEKNISTLSKLMAESHQSMKNDFEITVPEIDYLVGIIADFLGERGGVRMTGGGFGGCVVALVPNELVNDVKAIIEKKYYQQTALTADIFVCRASQGAEAI